MPIYTADNVGEFACSQDEYADYRTSYNGKVELSQ